MGEGGRPSEEGEGWGKEGRGCPWGKAGKKGNEWKGVGEGENSCFESEALSLLSVEFSLTRSFSFSFSERLGWPNPRKRYVHLILRFSEDHIKNYFLICVDVFF